MQIKTLIIGFIIGIIFTGAIVITGYAIETRDRSGDTTGIDPDRELARLIANGFEENQYTREELRGILEKSINTIRANDIAYKELSGKYGEAADELGIARGIIDGSITAMGEIISGISGLEGKALRAKQELLICIENIRLLQKSDENI